MFKSNGSLMESVWNQLATLNVVMTYLIFLAYGTFIIDTVLSVSVTKAGRD